MVATSMTLPLRFAAHFSTSSTSFLFLILPPQESIHTYLLIEDIKRESMVRTGVFCLGKGSRRFRFIAREGRCRCSLFFFLSVCLLWAHGALLSFSLLDFAAPFTVDGGCTRWSGKGGKASTGRWFARRRMRKRGDDDFVHRKALSLSRSLVAAVAGQETKGLTPFKKLTSLPPFFFPPPLTPKKYHSLRRSSSSVESRVRSCGGRRCRSSPSSAAPPFSSSCCSLPRPRRRQRPELLE